MFAAARRTWPEIDDPAIVRTTTDALIVPVDQRPLQGFPWTERDCATPSFQQSRIDLHVVEQWMMGYDPRSNILAWRPIQ